MSSRTDLVIQQYLPKLQEIYLENVFTGRNPTITMAHLAADRRTHPRIARELLNTGLLIQASSGESQPYIIQPNVLQSLAAVSFDICEVWKKCLDSRSPTSVSTRPWVGSAVFDPMQKKTILESDSYDFFAVSREAYSDWGTLADDRATVLERNTKRYQRYWDGPFKQLADVQKVVGTNFELIIAVSSEQLRTFVPEELAARKFKSVYSGNALWGLVACGIVDERVVFDESHAPRFDGHFRACLHQFPHITSNANADEGSWADNLNSAITSLATEIERLNSKLATYKAISAGIEQFGGWEKFKLDYARLLKQYLASKPAPSTSDSDSA